MRKHLTIAGCLVFQFQILIAQHLPHYNIEASLNDRDHSLDGSLSLTYTNNSTDTIHFLWFNVYPNAFKSDRTAFSEYLLNKGRTDFYFADPGKRGYINRLAFRSGDDILAVQDHPLYIDVIKVLLKKPLSPGGKVVISTPFHVKIPYNFDGIGYKDGNYNVKYWYPAVADTVMPFTNPDFSSNVAGDYDVTLKLPSRLSKFLIPAVEKRIDDSTTILNFSEQNVKDLPIHIARKEVSDHHDKPGLSERLSKELDQLISRPLLPAVGYNNYDGIQLGIIAHDTFTVQGEKLNYYVAPLYTLRSKSVAGIAGVSLTFIPEKFVDELEVGVTASTFSYNDGTDSLGERVFAKLFKVVPYIKATLPTRSEKIKKSVVFRSYILNERDLEFVEYSVDSFFYPSKGKFASRFVNELSLNYSSIRVLYPYSAQLQVQQGLTWIRFNATGNYFFNYPKGGGMSARVFASKFGYLGNLSASEKFATSRYQPKLTAVRGFEDFTYSNYFIGRNEFDGFASHQIMMRDGGLKLRTDLFEGSQGRSDNWLAAVNLATTIPKIFPVDVPVKIFFDAGTFGEAWKNENPGPRFLYVSGVQLSLFKNMLNIYAPVLYSKQYRALFKSVPEENKFFRKVSFSLNFQPVLDYLNSSRSLK